MSDKQISADAAEAAEARSAAIENIKRYCHRSKVGFSDLARRAGLSASVVSEVIRGLYKGDVDVALSKIESAISAELTHDDAPSGGFVTIGVAKQVFAVCRTAVKLRTMAAMYAESGVGKTASLTAAMQSQFRNGIMLTVDERSISPLNFLNALVKTAGKRGARQFWKRSEAFSYLVDLLSGSARLVVIDEADKLNNQILDIVRQLHDAAGVPIVLAGRPPLARIIARTANDDRIGASVCGRISIEVAIRPGAGGKGDQWYTVDEMSQILAKFKLKFHRGAAKWLCMLANYSCMANTGRESGALRRALKCFEMAALIAKEREITLEIVKQAYSLIDPDGAAVVAAGIDRMTEQVREAKTA